MGFFDFLLGRNPHKWDYDENLEQEKASVEFQASHKWNSTDGLTDEQIVEYFRDILLTEFSEYEVKEKVAVTELVGEKNDSFKLYKTRPYQAYKAEWGEPYTFVVYRDGEVKGVVMLGDKRSHGEKVKYLIARMYAKKANIPYISFYTHLSNDIAYVVLRIRKYLAA